MTIKSRLRRLEKKQTPSRPKPIKPIYQDCEDPNIWYETNQRTGDPGEPMTWDQVKEKYPDHMIIGVNYKEASHDH
jgi:hypothetical protein